MAHDAQARLKSIVETAVDGIFTFDQRGDIESFSLSAERIFGYEACEVIGVNLSILMSEYYHDEHNGLVCRWLAMGDERIIDIGRDVVGRRKDGSTLPLRLVVGGFWLGERRMFTGVVHDLTELKCAEERAVQSQRLAAMGQMISVLTHESRNALQLMQANLDILNLEYENQPDALECVSRIQTAQDRLGRLFQELREFAAPISLDLEICDLGHSVGQVLSELSPLHSGKEFRLREDAEHIDCRCAVDPFRMHQVFRNLLENSIAVCPDPMAIKANWSAAELDCRPALRLSLSDNGPGLTCEQRAKAFEPFFTTKPRGMGLGLAITKRIIESHSGQIVIGNNGAAGAEFVITIPRRAACA